MVSGGFSPLVVNEMTIAEAARWYLGVGLRPIPWVINAEGKKIVPFRGFRYATYTVSEEDLRRWEPHWQVGLALADHVDGAGVRAWAFDIDSHEQLMAWELEHGAGLPLERRGWRQISGRDGGEHRLYAHPRGTDLAWPADGPLPGYDKLEIVSNGLLAVAPSVHPSGRTYTWADGQELDGPPVLLRSFLSARAHSPRAAGTSAGTTEDPGGDLDLAGALRTGVVTGGDDTFLARLVYRQMLYGQPDEVIAVLWSAVAGKIQDPARPFTERDFQRHLNGAREKIVGYAELPDDKIMELMWRWQRESNNGLSNPDLIEPSGDELVDGELAAMLARARRARRVAEILRHEEYADSFKPPTFTTLTAFLAQPDEAVRYRVDTLWPENGRVLLAAQYKAGKTTLRDNLVRSLVDGEPLLGEFAVQPVDGAVAVLDLELSEGMMRRWLRDQGVQRTDAVIPVPLRGNARALNLLDDQTLTWWAEQLRARGVEVVILDCLRPALDALGLSEDKDAGRYLVKFDELLDRSGAREGVVVHHMGHLAERSRGDSRLRDWPDVEWQLVRVDPEDPRSSRIFTAMGRDVDVPARNLAIDPATRRLTASMAADIRTERELRSISELIDQVVATVMGSPGITMRGLREEIGGRPATVAQARDAAVRQGLITVTEGNRRAQHHWPIDGGEEG